MPQTIKCRELKRAPTLNTILMVEATLKNADNSIMTVAEIKRKLPKQVNHNVLKTILEYLEESNKIAVSIKGITWVHNDSKIMKKALRNSYNYPADFPKKS